MLLKLKDLSITHMTQANKPRPAPWNIRTGPAGTGKSTQLAQHTRQQSPTHTTLLIMNASDLTDPAIRWHNPYLSGLTGNAATTLPARKKRGLTIIRLDNQPWMNETNIALLQQAFQKGYQHYFLDTTASELVRQHAELLEVATTANRQGSELLLMGHEYAEEQWQEHRKDESRTHLWIR